MNNEGKTVLTATHDYAVISEKPERTLACANGKISDSELNKTHINFEKMLEKN